MKIVETARTLLRPIRPVLRAVRLERPLINMYIALDRKRRYPKGQIWVSETSKARARLAPYCVGYGLDLGFGGDPITESAIRVDMPQPYTSVGSYPVQLGGDAANLVWFRDATLDFIYSSHLLEDYDDVQAVLNEWLRVLKPGGRLVIYCPDEQRFRHHCTTTGQPYNPHHKHADFSLEYVKTRLAALGQTHILHQQPDVDIYSWELVCVKH